MFSAGEVIPLDISAVLLRSNILRSRKQSSRRKGERQKMNEQQYQVICARRQAYDSLVWQVPSLAIAGQSFLLATALNPETRPWLAVGLSVLASIVGLASYQLMQKHRQFELEDSERLVRFETDPKNANKGYTQVHGGIGLDGIKRGKISSFKSFGIWSVMLLLFAFASIASLVFVAGEIRSDEPSAAYQNVSKKTGQQRRAVESTMRN